MLYMSVLLELRFPRVSSSGWQITCSSEQTRLSAGLNGFSVTGWGNRNRSPTPLGKIIRQAFIKIKVLQKLHQEYIADLEWDIPVNAVLMRGATPWSQSLLRCDLNPGTSSYSQASNLHAFKQEE